MKKRFLFLLLISATINVICFLPYVGTYVDRIQQRFWPTSYYNVQSKDNEVIDAVINASLSMDGSAFSCEQPKRGFIYDVHNFIYPVHSTNLFNNYSHSYLYAGLSEYAFKKKNKRILNHLVQETKKFTAGNSLTYRLQEVDQIPIGICFLNLYQITGEECYLNIAKSIYKWLLGRRESNSNIIYYRKGDNQFIDALGMYVPFLVKYSKVTGDTLAYAIAKDNVLEFYAYGVDKETGIPVHGYNKKTHIKVGSSNWGRGIGWYLLAASCLSDFHDKVLDTTLPTLNESQFPCTSGRFDSSAALMFDLYMQGKGIHPYSVDFIKPYITLGGAIQNCSGDTYDFNNHSFIMGAAELTQGLFLMLVSNK